MHRLSLQCRQFITNPDPHQGEDYEVNVNGGNDADFLTVKGYSQAAAALTNAPFDFSGSLKLN